MKRFFKNLCLACAFAVAGSVCLSNVKTVTANEAERNAPSDSGIVLVNGYEDQKDFNSVYMYNEMGKIEMETANSDYIKSGKGSAKLTVQEDIYDGYRNAVYPTFTQSNDNVFRGLECKDFSKTIGVAFDIYNAQGVEDKVGVQLVYYRTYHSSMSTSPMEWHTLQPGWNTVFINVVRENIPKTEFRSPVTGKTETGPFSISTNLMFNRNPEGEGDKVYYVDDYRLFNTDTPMSSATEAKPLKDGEFCSFDQVWQIDKMRYSTDSQAYKSSGSWTKEFSSDGGASLRVDTPASEGVRNTTYLQMHKSTFIKDVYLKDYDDNDVFAFDIYSPTENGFNGRIGFYVCVTAGFFFWENISVTPGQVTRVRYTIEELNTLGEKHFKAGVGNSAEPNEYNCFANMTYLQLAVSTGATPTVFYLDNMRIERVEG